MAVRISDIFGERGFGGHALQRIIQQSFELGHQRFALRLPDCVPVLSAGAPDFRFDPVHPTEQTDELRGDRRFRAFVQIDKASAQMCQAEGEFDRACVPARGFERLVGGIAVHLQNACVIRQLRSDRRMAAGMGMDIADGRRRRTSPWAIIDTMSPELIDPQMPLPRVKDRKPRFIHMDPGLAMNEA